MLIVFVLPVIFCKLWKKDSKEKPRKGNDGNRWHESRIHIGRFIWNNNKPLWRILCSIQGRASKRYVPDRRQVRLWFPVALRALAPLVSGVIASHNISLLNEL